ncbi:MAG TPA: SgcJ/EcaC family oxidoreductase [Bryobacteraceae bacterium]
MTTDEQMIRELPKQLQDAWNAGDSTAFAAPFADDAVFIHIYGGQIDGRTAIQQAHRAIFEGIYKGSSNQYTIRSVRFIRPDVAIVRLDAQVRLHEGSQPQEILSRPTLFVTKENGQWIIQGFQNTRISEMRAADCVSIQ